MSESENIDLPKNVCVAKDAFDQFQAASACEEEEYITLSDIVDPPPPTLDLNACLDEIQDDIGVVSETDGKCDENIFSESTVELGQGPLTDVPTSSNKKPNSITRTSIQKLQNISENISQPPKKRGRRKKNTLPIVDEKQFNTSSESVISIDSSPVLETGTVNDNCTSMSSKTVCDRLDHTASSEADASIRQTAKRRKILLRDTRVKSQQNIIPVDETFKPRKRGRPRKVNTSTIQHDQSHSNQDDCVPLEKSVNQAPTSHSGTFIQDDKINITSDTPMSNVIQCSVKSVLDTENFLDKKTPRRRGRPRKSNLLNADINKIKSNNINNTTSLAISKQNPSVSGSIKPDEVKTKATTEDKKYDGIELDLSRIHTTPTKELEEKNSKTECRNEQMPSRKRERKPKKVSEQSENVAMPIVETSQSNETKQTLKNEDIDDEADDICLSSLKKRLRPEDDKKEENTLRDNEKVPTVDTITEKSENSNTLITGTSLKHNSTSDFEYNVDTIASEIINKNAAKEIVSEVNNSEIESPSKRPLRNKAKKVFHYDEGSDEDPFANVELSDDEDLCGRKGGRCYSDDEYIPGKRKRGKAYTDSESSASDSDLEKNEDTSAKKLSKKKGRKSIESFKKNQRKQSEPTQSAISDVTSTTADTTTLINDNLENSLQSPDITTNENSSQKQSTAWGTSHEFENFIAQKIQGTNLKIKKLTGTNSNVNAIMPLEIPVLDLNEPKKTKEMFTQTNKISTKSVEVQATCPYDSVMKCKVPLTAVQSEKACEFLKSIVNNTSELGQLMIQKSEDFIQKKINTRNITDTNKLDYCVQKSFLLFKLAKHNLVQMEEDLANEYEQFLKSYNMSHYRESPKCITANLNQSNSDSDCEIVEETVLNQNKEKEKSKFNLKTVFLNKELSIKIAKKSAEEPQQRTEKVNVRSGRHTVWINDSIMVKKVKPTQSFLAQDSRNKKPPDSYVTIEMVREFFNNYNKRQHVLLACAPFVSTEWLNVKRVSICNYFIAQPNDLSTHSHILCATESGSESNVAGMSGSIKKNHIIQPTPLLTLCTKALQKYMFKKRSTCKDSFYQPNTLFRLSFKVIFKTLGTENSQMLEKARETQTMSSLEELGLENVNTGIHKPVISSNLSNAELLSNHIEDIDKITNGKISNICQPTSSLIASKHFKRNVISLFSCCVETIQKINFPTQKRDNLDINENSINAIEIKTLKYIAFEKIKLYLYHNKEDKASYNSNEILQQTLVEFGENHTDNECCLDKTEDIMTLTIKSVNTLSDDVFARLPDAIDEGPLYSENDGSNYDEFEPDYTESNENDNLSEESDWVSRVQLLELKSCFLPIDNNSKSLVTAENEEKNEILASIKIEPLEEAPETIDTSIIKTEVTVNYEMFNPLATKIESSDNEVEDNFREYNSSSYDVDAFEEFARRNKMLHSEVQYDWSNDEVFSQSALRVRKQHEPDMDDEPDTSMSLLVPQQNTELAKNRLMKSSTDEESNTKNNVIKKKRKIRPKISRQKNKDSMVTKNKNTPEYELALLTRKMQARIRQDEKSGDSSESSDHENSLAKLKNNKSKKESVVKTKTKTSKEMQIEIQCNAVDSSENLNDKSIVSNEKKKESMHKKPVKMSLRRKSKYETIMNCNASATQDTSFVIQPDTPVELLECEPTLPMMYDHNMENIQMETENDLIGKKTCEMELQQTPACIDRYGWKCYPVNNNDTKLYENSYILLEKLPESFVETYFRYQGVPDKSQEDTYIDRLTNLQSLYRSFSKDNKVRSKTSRVLPNGQLKSKNTESDMRSSSLTSNDHCDELTPSEDEGTNIDDEIAPAPGQDTSENVMAKNSLMDDMDSDSEQPTIPDADEDINKSLIEENDGRTELSSKRYRPGPKSKKGVKENNGTLLTADKMMNKELTLLHGPVKLDTLEVNVEDAPGVIVEDTPRKPSPKNVNRTSPRLRAHLTRQKLKHESSSEEEKQWVTTKEKLLKRLGKKQENSSVDDAKRAKIVSEFIEKRGDAHEKRPILRTRKRRSRKRFLERKKQMSILNRELFGDTSYAGRKHSQTLGKGRRNIRKVIDKKSLARSTVIANMEEFERKRRLNMQQTRLREELGCEEGVNVLVINDEVCLEYDFEQMRPVVTIHPFFTKVMKAHQYEGVKFMWDACFESLSMVSTGHAGGGCILAHCMGLGKTLQVLALLHTVLTHPSVAMKRVLVCCPLSTVLNWVDEINKWIGPVTNQIKVFELSKLKKTYERAYQLEDWYKDGGIFIIGYELFRSLTTLDPVLDGVKPKIVDKIRQALLNPGPDVVVCDEGHLLKNDASVLAVAMSRVATRRRIVLTGTPMQNNLREYYCMVNFVKPNLLGTYAEYSNRFENPIMNGQHRDSQEDDIKLMKARTHILHKVLEGCLQRQEASVLYPYLPKKHEYTVFIPPTKCQWDLYKHYIMKYALERENKQQQNKKHNLLKDFHVLQKIWTHPQVLHNFLMKAREERNKLKEEKLEDDLAQEDLAASEDEKPNQTEVWWLQYLEGGGMLESLESSNKFVVVFQLLEEFITLGDKVLIFSTSLYTMDALEYFLKRINKWSLGQEYFRLDGSVPAEVRQKWCREFNAPHNVDTKLFLISTRAGCLGLNMTAANRVIILDTSWNPAHDIQSIFRVYRFGQKKDCYIYRLVSMGTMEQKIYERSVAKQAVSCRVVDEQQIDRHYNMAELTELYRYDEEGATVEAGLAAGVSDVALLRVAARARLHAVREHDSLLRGSREQHLPEHERNAAWMQFQQEHANNEFQDRLSEASQGIQHIVEAHCAQASGSVPVKMGTEEQPQQTVPQVGSKGKKSKKTAATCSTPPVEDSNSSDQKNMQSDAEKEEAKVKKIMGLLIKHNFHTPRRAHEITELVANVRLIVDAGGADLEYCDELTRSIATVMLQEEVESNMSSGPPPLTDIITGAMITDDPSVVIPDETAEELTDTKSSQNNLMSDPSEGSLLVPIMETRRQRGRPRKYLAKEVFEPVVKKPRGRPRKNTTDSDKSSINGDKFTATGKKSNRLMDRRRKSYVSDIDNCNSSKEQSPEIDDNLLQVSNQAKNDGHQHIMPDSDVTLVYDEDTRSEGRDCFVVPDVKGNTIQSEKKKTRAIAVKSTAKGHSSNTNLNGKVKRKAALAAKQSLERLDSEYIVTLDDDVEWVDDKEKNSGHSASKLTTTSRALQTYKRRKSKATLNTSKKSKRAGDTSILLSDDEDGGNTNLNTRRRGSTAETNVEAEETIPLHPSMLRNANFIKIVAFEYQSSRMLDEDAALLAARYSTERALKEYETTGKSITSGPIHDIAVKVLPKDLLKKLYNKKELKKNKATRTSKTNTESTSSVQTTSVTDTGPAKTSNGLRLAQINQRASEYTSQEKVVPIGMFRRIAKNPNTPGEVVVEECILPDDDDCILGTTDDTLSSSQNIYHKNNSQPLIITSVKASASGRRESLSAAATETIVPEIENRVTISAVPSQSNLTQSIPRIEPSVTITERSSYILGLNNPTYRFSKSNLSIEPTSPALERAKSTPVAQSCLTLTISEGKIVQPMLNASKNSVLKLITPKTSNDTICLDSDEEETGPANKVSNTVNTVGGPTPVMVTSAPTPVAVTTSVSNFSGFNNVQGIMMRINNADPETPTLITSDSQTTTKQKGKSQPKNSLLQKNKNVLVEATESTNREVPQKATKKVVLPEDVLRKARPSEAKKTCKPGDIVRITKEGNLAVLSRVDKLPNNVNAQLLSVSSNSTQEVKSQQSVAEKRKSVTASTSTRVTSPGYDPLSILKDVIHIQADEYDTPKNSTDSKQSGSSMGKSKAGGKITLQYRTKDLSNHDIQASISKNTPNETAAQSKNKVPSSLKNKGKDKIITAKPGTIDLTNLIANNSVGAGDKSSDQRKTSVVVGTSKDIIIRTKAKGSTITKASTSAANINSKLATAKRSSPWPKNNSPKKKKSVFRPTQTLEDFDIDDIDDIIELE